MPLDGSFHQRRKQLGAASNWATANRTSMEAEMHLCCVIFKAKDASHTMPLGRLYELLLLYQQ